MQALLPRVAHDVAQVQPERLFPIALRRVCGAVLRREERVRGEAQARVVQTQRLKVLPGRRLFLRREELRTQQKFRDDYLVSKVENLESAVKELTDDDDTTKFTIDELAVILDMNVDEIRDVLRLTGDDK